MNRNMASNSAQHPAEYAAITQIPNSARHAKQNASGDTGDNSACEQTKRPFSEEATNSVMTSKPTHTRSSTVNSTKLSDTQTATNQVTNSSRYHNGLPNQQENKTNLIINYLPPNMSQEEVRALFSSVGEVESCKLVREKTSGESLGYAFVKFYDPIDAGKAIKTLNGLRLQNKTVKVSLARPSSDAIKGANLYICGLPRKMTQTELEKLFGTCGHIITARILYDTKTGLSRGVAFIRYDQRAEAEVAIKRLNGYLPPGATEQITVKFANSPSSSRSENQAICYLRSGEGDNGSRFTLAPNGMPIIDKNSAAVCATSQTGQPSADGLYSNQIGNDVGTLGYVHSGQHLPTTPSSNLPCNSSYSYINNLETGPNPMVGTQSPVCFQTPILANGFPVPLPSATSGLGIPGRLDAGMVSPLHRFAGNSRLKSHASAVAATAFPNGNSVGLRSANGFIHGHIAPNFPAGLPPFGIEFMRNLTPNAQALLAPAFAASAGALTATGWRIFVYNLAPDTEESMLWQLFGPFGAVQTVKVVRDSVTNKCKGFGFVTMSNYEEALLAIHSLNGFHLGNRVLQVSFKITSNYQQTKYSNHSNHETAEFHNLTGSVTPVPENPAKS